MFGWQAPVLLGHPELLVPIGREVVSSAQGTVDFTWAQDFDEVIFRLANVVPVTNDTELHGRTSADGGSTFDGAATDYHLQSTVSQTGIAVNRTTGSGAPYLVLIGTANANHGIRNDAGEGGSGMFTMPYPFEARETEIYGWGGYSAGASANQFLFQSGGYRQSTAKVDAFRFFMSTGDIAEGTFEAWGLLPVERAA